MRPLLPSIEYDPHDAKKPLAIWIVNDTLSAYPGAKLMWRVLEDGKPAQGGGEKRLDIAADAAAHAVDVGPVPALAAGHAKVEVTLENAKGELLERSELGADDFLDGAITPPASPKSGTVASKDDAKHAK
jgi:hypothetical protein